MVRCGSWCCESGRCQSENGYFTTPGLHPTTGNASLGTSNGVGSHTAMPSARSPQRTFLSGPTTPIQEFSVPILLGQPCMHGHLTALSTVTEKVTPGSTAGGPGERLVPSNSISLQVLGPCVAVRLRTFVLMLCGGKERPSFSMVSSGDIPKANCSHICFLDGSSSPEA